MLSGEGKDRLGSAIAKISELFLLLRSPCSIFAQQYSIPLFFRNFTIQE